VKVELFPAGLPRADVLAERCRLAAQDIRLDPSVERIELCFDAPEFLGAGFWTVRREPGDRVSAALYGAPRDILTPPGRRDDPRHLDDVEFVCALPPERLDVIATDRWLHRNLLQLDDLLRGRVTPDRVPRSRATGLQAVWDVWTDGRLRHRQQPGLSQAERRRMFFRTFAPQGMLLPRHWATFHRLWEGRYLDQPGLLRALEELPLP